MDKKIFENKIDMRIRHWQEFKTNKSLFSAVDAMTTAINAGNKILAFGNGGSATQASHFTAELVNRFYFDRNPLPGISLTADIANLTCIANDSDYRFVFSRQLQAIGKAGDVAVGLTTSGKSANVLLGLEAALELGLHTVALCGKYTEHLHNLGIHDIISIPAVDTPVIQELHLFALHMIAEMLETKFFAGDK